MRNPIPAQHRFPLRLLFWGLALGTGVQLGASLASHLSPRVEVIEIREVIEMKPTPKGTRQSFEF